MASHSSPEAKLTEEQHTALSAHDRSVSLAAGAGCGKTFVLTERFLSYLDPQQLEPSAELTELVAITFTDAAAREMRSRVRRRCYERLHQAQDAGQRAAWKRLLSTLDSARISTIHSFCATLLRNYAAEAALDPRFELLDPPTAQLLRLQNLDDHFRQQLIARDENLIQLATHFGLRNLRDYVADLLGNNVQAAIANWQAASPATLVAHWRDHYETEIAPAAMALLFTSEPVQQLRKLCQTAPVTTKKFQARAGEILALLDDFTAGAPGTANTSPHTAAGKLCSLAKVQGVCTKKDWEDLAAFEDYKQTCTAVRALANKSILRTALADGPLLEVAKLGLDLLRLVAAVDERYTAAKGKRNVLEFDDLLSRTHDLLVDDRYPQVRESLAKSTQLLMVDEFQDTDPLQVAIVKAIRGPQWAEQGLFVVGDFKQSIYRFRGAEPRVSSALRATLPTGSRLSLTTNFRSQPAIVDFVNALFHDAFAEGYQPLIAHRPQRTPTPAIEFLWSFPEENHADASAVRRRGQTALSRQQEARFIARRLAQMIDSNAPIVVDTSAGEPTTRPLQLGDIAILLRTLSDVALYEEALREYGLDYYLAGGHAFYAQQEIYDVLHLLRTIASPIDELSLAGLLRSPMFALEDETLFWLIEYAGSLGGGLFGESLPDQLSPSEASKALRASTIINELRHLKDKRLVAQLLSEAIALTGYDATLLTEFLGGRKLANVQKLVEQARTLDRTRPGDLNGFVTQLSEFVVRAPKEPLAATRADGDVIRIMTVHYAKGLEFPLVVVPDLDRPNFPGSRTPVFDPLLGPLVPAENKADVVGWDFHQFAEQQQETEERRRLLYVACTRAADYLLLSSSVTNLQKPKSDWLQTLGEHFNLTDGTCLTDLPPGYHPPTIQVTLSEPETTRKPIGPARGADLHQLCRQTQQLAAASRGVVPSEVQPIAVNNRARQQFSFSRLSGQLMMSGEWRVASGESASQEEDTSGIDVLGLGTLVHAVLERINFTQPEPDLAGLCQFLAPEHVENDPQTTAAAATEMVERFLASPRAAELAQAKQVLREVEFLLPWPMDSKTDASRYLHGYIDCLYQNAAGAWHVLDYKSNRVDKAGVAAAAESYAMQMFVYGLACEQALGVPPAQCVLHFLRPSQDFACSFDERQRQQLVGQIDQAILAQITPE